MKYKLSPDAEIDLDEIWEYIAQDNSMAADRVVEAIDNACNKLADNPRLGRRRAEIPTQAPARYWTVYKHYVIVYVENSKPLYVMRIVSGYRNLTSLLGENES